MKRGKSERQFCAMILIFIAITLVTICTVYQHKRWEWTIQTDKIHSVERVEQWQKPVAKHRRKTNSGIIIYTYHRCGSTFLGELFNQHPDSFYTFEPLYPFGDNRTSKDSRRIKLLSEVVNCTFPEIKLLFEQLSRKSTTWVDKKCLKDNLCFRYKLKDLCSRDFCKIGKVKYCSRCTRLNLDVVRNICRSKKISVVKVIRLSDIVELESLVQEPTMDVKIIHLVRDPRGIASSRMKLHSKDVLNEIRLTCRLMENDMKAAQTVDWLKNRYMFIRYEDMALNPMAVAQQIYDFAGLTFANEVKTWIVENTGYYGIERESSRFERDPASDPFSTKRNSIAAMQDWRRYLSIEDVAIIEKSCNNIMSSMGYRRFGNENEMRNFSISALL